MTQDAEETETPGLIALCSICRMLNDQRIELDRRILALAPDDLSGNLLRHELDDLLEKLQVYARKMARVSATGISEVRSKAQALASFMRSDNGMGGSLIPDDMIWALALSLVDDLANLTTESRPQAK